MCSLLCLRFSSIFGYVSSEGITDACSFEERILGLEETNSEELVVDDICAIEDVDDVEEVDGFYLDSDDDTDNDVKSVHDSPLGEEADNIIGEYEENTQYAELDYSMYNTIPISFEHVDQVAVTLDKLIKNGLISKEGIFYKYLKDVLQVYVTPTNYSWDPGVIEFFKTLKWLGGQSTVNMLRGPMWHGEGRGGAFNPRNMVSNLGGPSDRTLTKQGSGYTTESGILNPLMQTFHNIIEKEKSIIMDCDILKVLSVHAENDGTALQPQNTMAALLP